jgi:hypothetical protein
MNIVVEPSHDGPITSCIRFWIYTRNGLTWWLRNPFALFENRTCSLRPSSSHFITSSTSVFCNTGKMSNKFLQKVCKSDIFNYWNKSSALMTTLIQYKFAEPLPPFHSVSPPPLPLTSLIVLKKAGLKIKTCRIIRVPEVLYECVSWFRKLIEGRLKNFENGLLRRILGRKGDWHTANTMTNIVVRTRHEYF